MKDSENFYKQHVNGVRDCICQHAFLTKQAEDRQRIKGKGIRAAQAKTLSKVNSFHIHSSRGRRECDVSAGQWASPGLAAAVLKLKWHFLSEAFRQTALFCPFTRNLRDTQTPFTKNKSGHLKHTAVIEETDSGFYMGGKIHGANAPADRDITQNEK